ncbi:uroporphyrinogen decarboxylase family protein [Clostridium grantii]|uniref:Uroporphyrinogen decarboxylase n=1 Tax=Clostridium grantii DSM 8605 TaxID=1121316 RepID=A0A1M5U304_9CLOT|nr:uroporphyrinogen decarboxylase family protein [Clostridium grantii]SHH57402.1 uroporphyrinogen decarboxylase [Clostridium grantii DSM 8605]
MNSKERVRKAFNHITPDRVPANFECVSSVMEKLQKYYGFNEPEEIYKKFDIDIRCVGASYIGPEFRTWNEKGNKVTEDFWGFRKTHHWTGKEYNTITSYYPLDEMDTIFQIENYRWPDPDWFDYESIKYQCDRHKNKAIIIGHEGPFQNATNLRSMEKLFIDMALDSELAHKIFDKMVEFELEYYERMFIAADGQIDILRPHDDYGTQINLLFSTDMWREYFKENTRKLTALAHKYGAFYQQHSCGAVYDIIPELIDCGVDSLEPIQKVIGMDPANLKFKFGDKLTFHGGIDTQGVLPFGTPEEVKKETKHFIDTLNIHGGYILMASQSFEGDVPIENIAAMYSVRD